MQEVLGIWAQYRTCKKDKQLVIVSCENSIVEPPTQTSQTTNIQATLKKRVRF